LDEDAAATANGWVDADGRPFDSTVDRPAPGQTELALGLSELSLSTDPTRRFWSTSIAREDDELGCFDYDALGEVFLGRHGLGPLRIGCDTNVLIDILQHGTIVLSDEPSTNIEASDGEEVEALVALLELWMTRDIRLVVSERQARDYRGPDPGRLDIHAREGEISELNAGWAHVIPDDSPTVSPARSLLLAGLPSTTDAELVALAIGAGCHVFLTRDRQLSRKRELFKQWGMAVMRPTELIDELAFNDGLSVWGADGGVCDNHKWIHLGWLVDPENWG